MQPKSLSRNPDTPDIRNNLIIVRGAGDLATGTISRLVHAGFDVLALETDSPSAIRRNVSFCEAVYTGAQKVEDLTCHLAGSINEAEELLEKEHLALLVDPEGKSISYFQPLAVVDAILAKKNLGTNINMADTVIALGPGFEAGKDCDYVIETCRGHNLGRVITSGPAIPDTGVPGKIAGFDKERVIHSPAAGVFRQTCQITDLVNKNQVIGYVIDPDTGTHTPVPASLDGILRGVIRDGYPVFAGMKIADIDPRKDELANCFTISDKARAIGGGVLEAVLRGKNHYDIRG